MNTIAFRTPTWLRVVTLAVGVCWFFTVLRPWLWESAWIGLMWSPLIALFGYYGIVQILFLVRGNPPAVELTESNVIVRNGWTTKVFDRKSLQLSNTTFALRDAVMLRNNDLKATITRGGTISTKQFAELTALLVVQ